MRIKFWGVRGSLPTPVNISRIRSKISAIIEQITPEDLVSAETRERFMADLPPWLFGTVGGNTPCVTIDYGEPECIVFDCGSGLRELGYAKIKDKSKTSVFNIFLSHFHWDHLQGIPFFGPGYNPAVTMNFYSPLPDLENVLNGQMVQPYFPVTFDVMGSQKTFNHLTEDIQIGQRTIKFKKMNHPGSSYAFCVIENGKRFIYSTDTELSPEDFMKTEENISFFKDADMIVIDCQYTLDEAIEKYNWGHSAFSMAVDFVANWEIKHMVMFHHDPAYDDNKLYGLLQSAKLYLERLNIKGIELTLAYEGMEITL